MTPQAALNSRKSSTILLSPGVTQRANRPPGPEGRFARYESIHEPAAEIRHIQNDRGQGMAISRPPLPRLSMVFPHDKLP